VRWLPLLVLCSCAAPSGYTSVVPETQVTIKKKDAGKPKSPYVQKEKPWEGSSSGR
jgi:hypothetical protein